MDDKVELTIQNDKVTHPTEQSLTFQSESVYKTASGEHVRIFVNGGWLQGMIYCGCCKANSSHAFDMQGKSTCPVFMECIHGDLVSLVDTSSETYSIKKPTAPQPAQSAHSEP